MVEQLKKMVEDFNSLNIDFKIEALENIGKHLADLEKQSAELSVKIAEGQRLQKNKDLQDTACKKQSEFVNDLKTKQATLSEKLENMVRELKQRKADFAKISQETKDLENQLRNLMTQLAADIKNNREQFNEKQKSQVALENEQKETVTKLRTVLYERKAILPMEISILDKTYKRQKSGVYATPR